MTEQDLLLDCLKRLNGCGCVYMLTGSMASNAWGIPRSTHDLDLVIQLPPSQVEKFAAAFRHPDYFLDEAMIRTAYQPPYQFNLLHIPSALKADFWMLRQDMFEQEMFRRRVKDVWMGETIWLATPEDVILHKLFWNKMSPSERQLGDVAGVVAIQQNSLDKDYMQQWARRLGVFERLEDALQGRLKPKST